MKKIVTLSALVALSAHAQTEEDPTLTPQVEITQSTQSFTEESTDWGHHKSDGASRLGMSSTSTPGKTTSFKTSTEIRQVIDVKQRPGPLTCESDIDLEYYQRDSEAEVRALLTSANCDDFDASYQLRIAYFDSDGKFKRIVADEEWPNDVTGRYRKTYPMEANSELKQVTSRILSCTCRQ
jgi:hypothetical protein